MLLLMTRAWYIEMSLPLVQLGGSPSHSSSEMDGSSTTVPRARAGARARAPGHHGAYGKG